MSESIKNNSAAIEKGARRVLACILAIGAVASGVFTIEHGVKTSKLDKAANHAANLSVTYLSTNTLDASTKEAGVSANLYDAEGHQIDLSIEFGLLTIASAGVALIASAGPRIIEKE